MEVLRRAGAITVAGTVGVILLSGCGNSQVQIRGVGGTPDAAKLDVAVASCGRNATVTAHEDADEVRLTAREDREPPWVGHPDCGDVVSVTLKEPLGQRKIIDTATGEELTPHSE